ncbi:MAG: prenyltransferase [Alkalimonas sp.]|nr:prenyltransferase [Alkalimonas sp.]
MLKIFCGVARLPFLTLTLLCILLAASAVWYQYGIFSLPLTAMVLLMALAAHISVNAFNEYFDFHSGLDLLTERTPFSGGSGTLVAAPEQTKLALALAISCLLFVTVAGLWLSAQLGWHLLWLGIPGVLLIYSYTQYVNKLPLLCLIAPGLGFGGFMTLGAYWVLAGQLDAMAISLSALLALLISNLLLLNQFPDVEADQQVGRRHLPIVLGRKPSAHIYQILLVSCYSLLLLAVWLQWLPALSLLALLTLPLAWRLIRDVPRYANAPEQLVPTMGHNVLLTHAFPGLVLLGVLISSFISPHGG